MPEHSRRHTLGSLDIATLLRIGGDVTAPITELCVDSKTCEPDSLFFALPGSKTHGIHYAQQAIAAGAQAIITDMFGAIYARQHGLETPLLVSEQPRRSLAIAASRFYARQPDKIIAVTGTNGKTSVAQFAMQLMQQLGVTANSFGTLGLAGSVTLPAQKAQDAQLTTPDPVRLHRLLANLVNAGCQAVAMEASSHGLAQHRVDGVRLTAAALTNITRDHLDYHASPEDYVAAKIRLFSEVLPTDGVAVLNTDDPAGRFAHEIVQTRHMEALTYGTQDSASLQLCTQTFTPNGQTLEVRFAQGHIQRLNLPLVGEFQAMNALAAAGLVIACGYEPEQVFMALPYLAGIPGRMETVAPNIYIDYAHTPDALATTLQAIRPHVPADGKLHVLFGAGGARDAGKRPLMGAAVAKYADVAMVTDDNPRNEDPAQIRHEIIMGAPSKILDYGAREEAIARAVAELSPADVLVIAGKGHETTQEIDGVLHAFNDKAHIQKALEETS